MVTCTAIASAILQHSRQPHASQSGAETEYVIAENIDEHEPPLSMLEISHGFKCVAGKSGKRAAEADDHQKPQARIYQDELGNPDEEKADNNAARNIDQKRAERKNWAELVNRKTAYQVTQVRANDGSDRNRKKVFHDRIISLQINLDFVGVISLRAYCDFRRLWRTPSP